MLYRSKTPQPLRGKEKNFIDITPSIASKVQSYDSMITVGSKVGGYGKGQVKVS